jgi:hypothetical protein
MTEPQPPARQKVLTPGIVSVLIMLVLVAAGAILLAVVTYREPPPPPEVVKINPTVKASMVELTIRNGDPFAYEQVEIVLNPSGLLQSGYSKRVGKINPGQTVTVSLINFADSGNERFQPLKTKLTEVHVFAKVKGKDAVAVLGF